MGGGELPAEHQRGPGALATKTRIEIGATGRDLADIHFQAQFPQLAFVVPTDLGLVHGYAGNLHHLLGQLSEEDRRLITMQSIEGRSVSEICEITGGTAVSVRVRAFRARARLRAALQNLQAEEDRQVDYFRSFQLLPQVA